MDLDLGRINLDVVDGRVVAATVRGRCDADRALAQGARDGLRRLLNDELVVLIL